jgi:hypothetical protein
LPRLNPRSNIKAIARNRHFIQHEGKPIADGTVYLPWQGNTATMGTAILLLGPLKADAAPKPDPKAANITLKDFPAGFQGRIEPEQKQPARGQGGSHGDGRSGKQAGAVALQ